MTVTGAANIFGELPGEASDASFFFPSALLTHTKRAGQQFAEVGPNFTRSYSSSSCCSVTARSVQPLRVRAVRNNRSRVTSSSLKDTITSVWVRYRRTDPACYSPALSSCLIKLLMDRGKRRVLECGRP